jgi:hypothetical protein
MKFKQEQPTESGLYWACVDNDMLVVYVNVGLGTVYSFYGNNYLDDKYVQRFYEWGDKIQEPTRD